MSSPRPRKESLRAQRALFGVLVGCAIALQLALFVNILMWPSAPDRGWYALSGLGVNIIGDTRPLGEEAGLRRGDRILAINGQPYETLEEMYAVLDPEIGHANVYTLERAGEVLTVSVPVRPLGLKRVLGQAGLFWTLGSVFLLMGVLVFLMKPYHGPGWAFLLIASTLGLVIGYAAPSSRFTPVSLDSVFPVATPFLPAALLHLTALFPQRREFFARRPWLIAIPYLASLCLVILSQSFSPNETGLPDWIRTLRTLYLGVALFAFLGSTVAIYLRTTSTAARLQSLVITTGSLIGLFVPLADGVAGVVFKVQLFPNPIVFYLLFLVFFPLSIGYAIVRHDLFEVDVIVRRTYGYMLSTGVVLTVYGVVASTLNVTLGPAARESEVFQVWFVLAVVLFFQPVHRRSQGFVDRIFYRAQYDYQSTITRASEAMMTILDPELVQQTLLGSVVGEMFLENGVLLLRESEGTQFEVKLVDGADWGDQPRQLDLVPVLVDALLEARVAVFRHEVDLAPFYEAERKTLQAAFDELDAEVMLPMIHQQELRGVFSLGRKKSGKMFTQEDLALLRTMTNQAVVALENARLFEEVAAGSKQIQLLESMKTNLAKFVPQTVQTMIEESPDAAELFEKQEKDVSVMFADMTGFTRLSSQLPLDQVNAIVERYFGAFFDEIQKNEGDVNETAGDGIMVLFQDGDSTEHARSAVRVALGIQRIADEINAERAADDPGCIPIGMHIGVNSGVASVGATKIQGAAGARWTYTASGPTTNVAARVEALGEKIAVTEETRRRLGEAFAVEEIGAQTLKNVKDPVMVYRVLEDRAEAHKPVLAAPAPEPQTEPERAGRFRILGRLRERESGRALPNLVVRAFDKDLIFDDHLGDAISDASGRFEIRFADELFRGLWDSRPDIYLRVFDASGSRELESTRDSVRWNVGAVESFKIAIPAEKLRKATERGMQPHRPRQR